MSCTLAWLSLPSLAQLQTLWSLLATGQTTFVVSSCPPSCLFAGLRLYSLHMGPGHVSSHIRACVFPV